MQVKKCIKCLLDKDIGEFYSNKKLSSKDKLLSYCKNCHNEKSKQYSKTYHKTEKGINSLRKAASKAKDSGYYRYGKGAINALRNGAEKRGISFDLTTESLLKWWNEVEDKCFYCDSTLDQYLLTRDFIANYTGKNFNISKFKKFYRNPKHRAISCMTIDRVENHIGYHVGNMVKSCWICNSIKGDLFNADLMRGISQYLIHDLRVEIEKESKK